MSWDKDITSKKYQPTLRDFINSQISLKNNTSRPYYGRSDTVKNVITDMDVFPYKRFFRGEYQNEEPTIFDREAGWRVVENSCYTPFLTYKEPVAPSLCFQSACSLTSPCYPGFLRKYSDKNLLDTFLNRVCVDRSP